MTIFSIDKWNKLEYIISVKNGDLIDLRIPNKSSFVIAERKPDFVSDIKYYKIVF